MDAKRSRRAPWRAAWAAALLPLACMAPSAHAENHALILWIGTYADPAANLPGIDLDAKAARQIAAAMGVPAGNTTEVSNERLTLAGLRQAIGALVDRIQPGDKVFFYYTGHGGQAANVSDSGKPCSEGLVAHDKRLYFDQELEADLARLGAKASQVVVMNDSCFSGGASIKDLPPATRPRLTPKAYPGPVPAGKAGEATGYTCGQAVNKGWLAKTLEVIPRSGAQLVYLAASRDDEIANATADGSVATLAWAACIKDPKADADRSGAVSAEELRACAQARIDGMQIVQHVTLTSGEAVPVLFSAAPTPAQAQQPVAPARTLQDLRAGADKAIAVKLTATRPTLRIGHDLLEFDVETQRAGYLYLFQVGSDGKTFNLLFPNKVDGDNRVPAGRHRFPRASWALKAAGPAGTDHLIALLADEPKRFADLAKHKGTFAALPATLATTKNLMVVATGASPGAKGRYGASEVLQVAEVP
jgi:hypothetical protein